MKKNILWIVFMFFTMSINANPTDSILTNRRELVIAQMNYCIHSLTNIIENNSINVLEHELNQLLNNLTMTEVVDLEEIALFRRNMLSNINDLQITNEERNLMNRIKAKQNNLMKWQALSNALNSFSFLLSGSSGTTSPQAMAIQGASVALLTAARTAIEYKTIQGQQEIEEIKQMWELRKNDLITYTGLRNGALKLVYDLFKKYNLNENERLTESTALKFNKIITTNDPKTRIRQLKDEEKTYSPLMDYYYHLGMAYIDVEDYISAKPYLQKYLSMYQNAPIFRYDEKSGCIALATLTFDKNLSKQQKEELVDIVIKNLPNNGAAIVQLALYYLHELNEPQKAYNLLRSGIDNIMMNDKNIIIESTIALLDEIKKYPTIFDEICAAIENCQEIRVSSYIAYLLQSNKKNKFDEIDRVIQFGENVSEKPGIGLYRYLFDEKITSKLPIHIDKRFIFETQDFEIYNEIFDQGSLKIIKYTQQISNSISKEDILDELDFINNYSQLLYYFFNRVDNNDYFIVKENIDYKKLQLGSYDDIDDSIREIIKNSLSDNERKDLFEYCLDNKSENHQYVILNSMDKTGYFSSKTFKVPYWETFFTDDMQIKKLDLSKYKFDVSNLPLCEVKFYGDSLSYQPKSFYEEVNCKLRIKINGILQPTLTYILKEKSLNLYSIEYNNHIIYKEPQSIQAKKYIQHKNKIIEEKNDTTSLKNKVSNLWNGFFKTDTIQQKVEIERKDSTATKSKEWYNFWN